MIRTATCAITVALGLTLLTTATLQVTAGSGLTRSGSARFGGRSLLAVKPTHAKRSFAGHRRNFGHGPVFDGYAGDAAYALYTADTSSGRPLVVLVSPPEPPHSVTCKRNRETVKVPSENGGTREVTITRC